MVFFIRLSDVVCAICLCAYRLERRSSCSHLLKEESHHPRCSTSPALVSCQVGFI